MNSIERFVLELLQEERLGNVLFYSFRELNLLLSGIEWVQVGEIALFIGLSSLLTVSLLLANDKVFDHYNAKRIKKHHLTIRNNGNVPSAFLFRTVDLPRYLAVRFRIGDIPMIWVSRKNPANPQQEEVKTEASKQTPAPKNTSETSLVPDLKTPFADAGEAVGKTVTDARKTVSNVGRTAGLLAGIISTFTNLFGIKSDPLKGASDTLKDVQQQSNQTIQTVNNKIGNADTLMNQMGSVIPKNKNQNAANGAAPAMQASGSAAGADGTEMMTEDNRDFSAMIGSRSFIFDEDVWHANIGKTDIDGGDLNYAMSKTLEPGESIRIDLDIMNLSSSSAPVSLVYKIEIIQLPQTNLQLAAPKENVFGIVVYPKISVWSRIIPFAMIIGLIVISLQILAGYSHFVF